MTGQPDIAIARVYDRPQTPGRARLLVDRLWPRGISKVELAPDDWLRDIAPSNELRKWFGHDPVRWAEFRTRYRSELDAEPEAVAHALDWCRRGPVTLLYSAHDREHNQAVVLQEYLTDSLEKRTAG
ncbi:MAG: DUF488 family protein [Rhodobacteraceae bacterium]|jgi:uncharacterized protein YeaO (DUF488 family)|nr:DUF488 family protein [Paracoccaceae bacterium]